ncbi:MAG: hypothetical protein ACE5JJ_05905 [Nitrospinota bacterium]
MPAKRIPAAGVGRPAYEVAAEIVASALSNPQVKASDVTGREGTTLKEAVPEFYEAVFRKILESQEKVVEWRKQARGR